MHREASKNYNENNPKVDRKTTKNYNKTPDVHCEASKKYSLMKTNLRLTAKPQKIQNKNPDLHCEASKKFNENNPEVNRNTTKKIQ